MGIAWALGIAVGPAAVAQEEAEEPEVVLPAEDEPEAPTQGDIEETVVRASQRGELLQDVSVAVTSFGTAELKSLRIQNIADLAKYTPSLEINTAFAASNPTIFIRGIGLKDYNANAAGAVAVYQDGININSPAIQLFQLFDTQSVDILRGPQGSLNGRNATAGAIMTNSTLPGDDYDVTGSVTYGNFNTREVEGAFSIPMIEEKLSTRFAFVANLRDGTTENQCADWDPNAVGLGVPALAEEGIDPVVSRDTTLTLYGRLTPSESPVMVRRTVVRPIGPPQTIRDTRHAYLDGDLVRRLNDEDVVTITDGTSSNSNGWELDQDVTLSDGRVYPAGTRVGLIETGAFQINDAATDGVCVLKAPGIVRTPLTTDGMPGQYVAANGVTSLEDFQGLQSHVNDVNNWATRGIVRFLPFDGMEWVLNGHGGQNHSDSRHLQMLGADGEGTEIAFRESLEEGFSEAGAARILAGRGPFEGTRRVKGLMPSGNLPGEGGDDPYIGYYNRDGTERLDTWGSSLKGSWDRGTYSLLTLSGFEWYDRFVEDEGDANPLDIFPADYEDSAWQFSQELRLEAEREAYLWRVGVFLIYEQLEAFNTFPDTRQFRIEQEFDQTLLSVAPYLSGRYYLSEQWRLDAGIRYNHESKDFTIDSSAIGIGSNVVSPAIERQSVEKTWTGTTGDVTLTWSPAFGLLHDVGNDFVDVYGRYARGMKGGHFNASLTTQTNVRERVRVTPVDPEFIDSIEAGIKSNWFANRLGVNAAVFRYWYKDLQVFDIVNELEQLPSQQLLNADANVLGAEVEMFARPIEGLFLQAGFSWLNARFDTFVVRKTTTAARGSATVVTTEFDYQGNPLIAAPDYSISGIAEYQIPLFGWGFLVPQYDFSYRTEVFLDPQHADPISQEPYWLHNARLAWRTPGGRLEVAGWVRNFTDEEYKVDAFDISREFNTILEVWGDPRTYGVTVSFAY